MEEHPTIIQTIEVHQRRWLGLGREWPSSQCSRKECRSPKCHAVAPVIASNLAKLMITKG